MAIEFQPQNLRTDVLGQQYLEVQYTDGGRARLYKGELDGETLGKLDLNRDAFVSTVEASLHVNTPEFRAAGTSLVKAQNRLVEERKPEPKWLKDGVVNSLSLAGMVGFLSITMGTLALIPIFFGVTLLLVGGMQAYNYVKHHRTPEQRATDLKAAEADLQAASAAHAAAWKKATAAVAVAAKAAPAVNQPMQAALAKP